MTNNIENIAEHIKKFKHKIENYVKFNEVDSFQVVHNLNYLLWGEVARVEYCRELGISILPDKNKSEKPFSIYLVHSEINYLNPATFFDNYIIYTRISKLGWSSITFENIITKKDGTPLCISQAVEVYVAQFEKNNIVNNNEIVNNIKNMRPTEIIADIREKIIDFEKDDLEISDKK